MVMPVRTENRRMKTSVRIFALSVALTACSDAPWPQAEPVDPEVLAAEHEEWRANRHGSLSRPDAGVISWGGLWELAEGANAFGSDPSLAIVLPEEDSPPHAGTLHLSGGQVRLEPAGGSGLTLRAGDPVTAPCRCATTGRTVRRSSPWVHSACGSTPNGGPTGSGFACGTPTRPGSPRSNCRRISR